MKTEIISTNRTHPKNPCHWSSINFMECIHEWGFVDYKAWTPLQDVMSACPTRLRHQQFLDTPWTCVKHSFTVSHLSILFVRVIIILLVLVCVCVCNVPVSYILDISLVTVSVSVSCPCRVLHSSLTPT